MKTSIPVPGLGEVLIRNKFVGINALYDRELYRGNVPYIHVTFPYVFGVEAVGIIDLTGSDVQKALIGKAVTTVKVGTAYQEYQLVSVEELTIIPEATPEYLTLNPTGVSALLALERVAEIQSGEKVVVSAAAGGLGHLMVQLCYLKGCHVIAICGGEHKVKLLESLSCCDRIIDYHKESVVDVLRNEYPNQIHVAMDSVGRELFDSFLENLAPKGRLVVCGLAAELSDMQFEKLHSSRVYESIYWKGASVRCFMNHLYREHHPAARAYLFDLYQRGDIQVKVDSTVFRGIEGIRTASEYLLAGKSCGKVIVDLSNE